MATIPTSFQSQNSNTSIPHSHAQLHAHPLLSTPPSPPSSPLHDSTTTLTSIIFCLTHYTYIHTYSPHITVFQTSTHHLPSTHMHLPCKHFPHTNAPSHIIQYSTPHCPSKHSYNLTYTVTPPQPIQLPTSCDTINICTYTFYHHQHTHSFKTHTTLTLPQINMRHQHNWERGVWLERCI